MYAKKTVHRRARHQSVERGVTQYTNHHNAPLGSSSNSGAQHPIATKPKGLKRILGKMRRANSGTIHDKDAKKGAAAAAAAGHISAGGSISQDQGDLGGDNSVLKRGGFR